MTIKQLINKSGHLLKQNTPVILSSTAITGVVTTAYLSARASVRAADEIRRYEHLEGYRDRKEKLKSEVKLVWRFYIPAAASGVVTIGCIIGINRVTNKRTAAAQAAFVISERAFSEYRGQVIEEYGEKKDKTFRDRVAEKRIQDNQPPQGMIVSGTNVLCCELYTGRYFQSDMETLRRAQNDLNARLLGHDQCSLDDWYWAVSLPGTSTSGDLGWTSDKMMELEFTSVLTDDGRPCLAFDYNYVKPLFDGMLRP